MEVPTSRAFAWPQAKGGTERGCTLAIYGGFGYYPWKIVLT